MVQQKINTTSATIDNTAQFQNWTIALNGISIAGNTIVVGARANDINLISDNTVPFQHHLMTLELLLQQTEIVLIV